MRLCLMMLHLFTNNPKKCFTCSVFTFIDNRLLCTNPGTCYSDYCYSYVLSDLRSMFLSGCAEDWSDFEFRGEDDRILCHAHGHFGLCLCRAGGESPCNNMFTSISSPIDTHQFNEFQKVTGFTADYARNRVLQMRVEGFPEKFPGSPLNTARFSLTSLPIILSFVIFSFLQ
ncbi:unnamed protein product [Haemonchus placei]|uniref:Uncharacterized protein n=1 Tax=Haemonchus placei TaxID=6290 RepID=A0A0N4X3E2_HAEPC|nr:unnamed protein product [Haemonchus placei]